MKPTRVTKYFLDTNVLVYATERISTKALRANDLIAGQPVVSVQVLNEFTRILVRKANKTIDEVRLALAPIKIGAEIVPVTLETHELALEIVRKHQFAIFDANIIAAAELAGCDVLYTEDLSDGQRIGKVTIRNPFV
jgi:predicted nucleic acid-binding protein